MYFGHNSCSPFFILCLWMYFGDTHHFLHSLYCMFLNVIWAHLLFIILDTVFLDVFWTHLLFIILDSVHWCILDTPLVHHSVYCLHSDAIWPFICLITLVYTVCFFLIFIGPNHIVYHHSLPLYTVFLDNLMSTFTFTIPSKFFFCTSSHDIHHSFHLILNLFLSNYHSSVFLCKSPLFSLFLILLCLLSHFFLVSPLTFTIFPPLSYFVVPVFSPFLPFSFIVSFLSLSFLALVILHV